MYVTRQNIDKDNICLTDHSFMQDVNPNIITSLMEKMSFNHLIAIKIANYIA